MTDLDYVVEQLVKTSEAFDGYSAATNRLFAAHGDALRQLFEELAELRDEIAKVARHANIGSVKA